MDSDKGRPEQKGYHDYRSGDGRSERDRTYREHDSRYERPGSSSKDQNQRNPFANQHRGGSGNGGGHDRYSSGNGSGHDRYSSGNGSDRYNRNDHYKNGNGGGRERDRYSSGNGGDRFSNGNGGGRDRYSSGNGNGGYNNGNGGGRSSGDAGHRDRYDSGSRYGGNGNDRPHDRSHSKQGSYDRRSGSGESNQDPGTRKRPLEDDSPGRLELGKRSPTEQAGNVSKKHFSGTVEAGTSSSGGGRSDRPKDGEKGNRPKRDRYEMIRTRPDSCISKLGSSGEPVRLKANYFELKKKPDYELVMYRVDFEPECELAAKRKYLMYTQRNLLGAYLYDTQNSVYLTHRLQQDLVTVESKDREGTTLYKMTIKFGTIVSTDTRESLQVYNLILRRAMEGLKLHLIGRNLFDAEAKINFNQFRLQLWPGYTTSIRQHEKGVLLCAEITSKVMRNETVYDILSDCGHGEDYKTQFEEAVLGLVVLTDYNNKTYRIDGISYDLSPSDTFDTKDGPVTFMDYYFKKYKIKIKHPTQPMIVTRSSDRQKRGGQEETILLVPELCRPTGLTEALRNNFQLMKAIAEYTRMDPRKRMDALNRFNTRLQRTTASQEILRSWNFELGRDLVEVNGRKLKNETIHYGNGDKEATGQFSDWQNAFRNKSMFLSYPLTHWCVLVPNKMTRQVQEFVNLIQRVSRTMHFQVEQPQLIDIDDRMQSYTKGFDDANRQNPQLIMAFVNNNNADKYSSIKKLGCCKYGVPTQVIVQKTLNNNKGLMSIATKVAIQLNCKLGGTPWLIYIPTRGLMTVGIDVSRDTKNRNVYWGAMVATMDLKEVSGETFFSCVSSYSDCSNFSSQLAIDITKALKAFQQHHKTYPKQIVIYRDGVGDGQIKHIKETELEEIKTRLEQMYGEAGIELKLVFVIVSKKVNTRIFGNDQRNPPSGTVVDDVITLPERSDFYLVSQVVRQGTVSPTYYNVIYDTLKLSPDRLQQLTYKMCHLYYNWAGTVRVPAVCQNAHKLSVLVAQFLHQAPISQLEKKLYFL